MAAFLLKMGGNSCTIFSFMMQFLNKNEKNKITWNWFIHGIHDYHSLIRITGSLSGAEKSSGGLMEFKIQNEML